MDENEKQLASLVSSILQETTITDIHTHLFPPSHGEMLLWGVDELLRYHYLVAELFTTADWGLTYEKFWSMSKSQQADIIWEHLFIKQSPLSEAARGVITTFQKLGLDVKKRDLSSIRKWFSQQKLDEYLPKVFEIAKIDYIIMTNNPFDPKEAKYWQEHAAVPDYFKSALRIDPLFEDWQSAADVMTAQGYDVRPPSKDTDEGYQFDKKSIDEIRRFLIDWSKLIKPVYFAASFSPDFAYGKDKLLTEIIDRAVIPAAMELGLPFALMIGARRGVNPELRDAGASVGTADLTCLSELLRNHPQVKFLVTVLARVNQHELTVLGRVFRNLHIFGCWWYCNNPSIIEEMTRQRIELLGTSFTAQHSDARVLDQLIYKWDHTREIISKVLTDKYSDLYKSGWEVSKEEIARDARTILGGSFEEFCRK